IDSLLSLSLIRTQLYCIQTTFSSQLRCELGATSGDRSSQPQPAPSQSAPPPPVDLSPAVDTNPDADAAARRREAFPALAAFRGYAVIASGTRRRRAGAFPCARGAARPPPARALRALDDAARAQDRGHLCVRARDDGAVRVSGDGGVVSCFKRGGLTAQWELVCKRVLWGGPGGRERGIQGRTRGAGGGTQRGGKGEKTKKTRDWARDGMRSRSRGLRVRPSPRARHPHTRAASCPQHTPQACRCGTPAREEGARFVDPFRVVLTPPPNLSLPMPMRHLPTQTTARGSTSRCTA
ncbi:hypothetical protein DFH09DRAFT_1435358, partial [Mycena vulgaris]